jgi:hypothetical protein
MRPREQMPASSRAPTEGEAGAERTWLKRCSRRGVTKANAALGRSHTPDSLAAPHGPPPERLAGSPQHEPRMTTAPERRALCHSRGNVPRLRVGDTSRSRSAATGQCERSENRGAQGRTRNEIARDCLEPVLASGSSCLRSPSSGRGSRGEGRPGAATAYE